VQLHPEIGVEYLLNDDAHPASHSKNHRDRRFNQFVSPAFGLPDLQPSREL
jgi:hypothetical protein